MLSQTYLEGALDGTDTALVTALGIFVVGVDEPGSGLVGGVDMMVRSSRREAKEPAMRLEMQDPSFDDGDGLDVMQCKMRRRKVDIRAEMQSRRRRRVKVLRRICLRSERET